MWFTFSIVTNALMEIMSARPKLHSVSGLITINRQFAVNLNTTLFHFTLISQIMDLKTYTVVCYVEASNLIPNVNRTN
ncbi:hypothetical protein HOLleu_39822 [Holothuria leucospilota]|uniref:Uncharacterized protein n=1 Tax=Holothuria leucospilota TaxID=206669 RepID=A0A9Q1BB82_HOLLE|nr:hypothetical protein HOLleu_43778 [Holothuria leucospilota]KAJ8020270.1 hypothetical protein HOLleu_39822 [Holothuria leucospilota]